MTIAVENEVDIDDMLSESMEKAEAEYRQLIYDLAEGKKTATGASVHSILFAAGRTVADLKRHVAMAKGRRQALLDLDEAESLKNELLGLEVKRGGAFAAYKEKQEQQQQELLLLKEAHLQAIGDYNRCKEQSRNLERDAVRLLGRTTSQEYRDGFDRLSTAACKLAQAAEEAKLDDRKARGRLPELEAELMKHEVELPRLDSNKTCKSAAEKMRSQIAKLQQEIDTITNGKKINELTAKHEAAVEALKAHEAGRNDWRNMRFD